ncbi:MAG: carbon monoxide dehydrogenase subunit G [Woeseiaceae bacterium]|nr:carbon monoxide dehydrogenase subunit G [Woeseiaceae bacterium]
MEIKGEYQIGASREQVWQALNDPQMLKKCIPGCESIEKTGDNAYKATVMAAIGPVRARFNTSLSLENLNPPDSYTLVGESKAGAAGFGRGSADVALVENDDGTLLTYSADFKVGGKLAQVGSRLVLGATRKTADDFFGKFSSELDPGAQRLDAEETGDGKTALKLRIALAGAAVALLIWWFLLR